MTDRGPMGTGRVIRPHRRFEILNAAELWRFRELLLQLAVRDVMVRYKQAFIGFAWAIIQPVASMVIFTVIFGNLAGLDPDGVPYPILTFAGLLPMITERSLQARFLIPMAISLAFGVMFATAITLLLVPSLYMILEDIKTRFFFTDSTD